MHSSDEGRSFSFTFASPPDSEEPHWLPNIERPTGHNDIGDDVGFIYTAGGAGPKLKALLSNKVYFAQLG